MHNGTSLKVQGRGGRKRAINQMLILAHTTSMGSRREPRVESLKSDGGIEPRSPPGHQHQLHQKAVGSSHQYQLQQKAVGSGHQHQKAV